MLVRDGLIPVGNFVTERLAMHGAETDMLKNFYEESLAFRNQIKDIVRSNHNRHENLSDELLPFVPGYLLKEPPHGTVYRKSRYQCNPSNC